MKMGSPNAWRTTVSCLCILYAMLIGCSQPDEDRTVSNSAVIAMPNFPGGKGNPYTGYATPSITLFSAIFDGFTNLQADGRFEPALATRWEQIDATTWVFDLREGVFFGNGEPFNAHAVTRAAEFLRSDEAARYVVLRELAILDSVEALGDYQVRITTTKPSPMLPRVLSAFRIVAPAYWDEVGAGGYSTAPVGTGPFKVESWDEAKITLVRNEGAWRQPKLDRLEILALSDAAVRLQTLTSGEVDIAMVLSPEDRDLLEASGYRLQVQRATSNVVLTFITEIEGPLQDSRVRRALNMAIDRDAILEVFLDGAISAPTQPAVAVAFGYNPDLPPYRYEPEKAKQLLADAGYPDGFTYGVDLMVGGISNDTAIYQQIIADLKKIGVVMEPKTITLAQLVTGLGSGVWQSESFLLDYNILPALDAMSILQIHSCRKRVSWFCDESKMPLIERALAEVDLERREALTREVMADMVEDPPALILFEAISFHGVGPRIKSFGSGFGIIEYEKIEVTP